MAQHFTVAYGCVLVAALLPLACAVLAKAGALRKGQGAGGYDNHHPRAWLAQLSGWPARANAAQANTFEALPFFIGAVVIAHQLGAAQGTLDALAVAFVLLRMAYVALYVADKAGLRSVVWGAALLVNIALLLLGAR